MCRPRWCPEGFGESDGLWYCKVNLQSTLSIPISSAPSPAPLSVRGAMDVKALSYEGFSGVAVGWRMEQHGSVGTGVRVARMGQRGSIPAGAEGPRGNLWAGTAFPGVLTTEKRERVWTKASITGISVHSRALFWWRSLWKLFSPAVLRPKWDCASNPYPPRATPSGLYGALWPEKTHNTQDMCHSVHRATNIHFTNPE